MSIFLSALAAAGDAGVQSMNQNIQQQNQMDLEQHRADLAEQKAKTLAEFNTKLATDTENQKRTAQVGRINTAKTGIIDSAINKKWASSDAAVSDADAGLTDSPLTAEQRAVIDRAKQGDREALMTDPATLLKAATQTGDVNTKEMISIMLDQHRQEAMAASEARKAKFEEGKLANDEERNRIRDKQVDVQQAKVDAYLTKIASGEKEAKVPAEIAITKYLIENKDDPIAMAAWDKAHSGKTKDRMAIAAEMTMRRLSADKFHELDPSVVAKESLRILDALEDAALPAVASPKPAKPILAPAVPAASANDPLGLRKK